MPELISVIVPMYNVEKYIDRCVESIVNQTYKNLEIILVDDGSTDRSGEVCERWAHRDVRVKVIHRKNGGAAAARNTGLDVVNGTYVMFVDSDDYVSSNICERLIIELQRTRADISICRMEKIEANKIYPTRPWNYDEQAIVMSQEQALREYFLDKIDCGPCHKLFSRRVFNSVRFPEGVINEDFVFVYKALFCAKRIVFFRDILYHYCFRENSVTSSQFSKKSFDRYYNCVSMITYLKDNAPAVLSEGEFYFWRQTFYLMKELLVKGLVKEYSDEYKKMESTLRGDFLGIIHCKYISIREKISYLLIVWFPKIYEILHTGSGCVI